MPLYRPDFVAGLVNQQPLPVRQNLVDAICRIVANPRQPVGLIVDTVRPLGREPVRMVVEACPCVFITYDCINLPPLMREEWVRVIAITPLEYARPF